MTTHSLHRARVGLAWVPAVILLLAAALVGGLTGTHPRQGVMVAVVVGGMIVLALNPQLATLVVVVLLYSNAAVIASTVHGLPGLITAGVLLLLLIPLLDLVLVRHEPIMLLPALPWLVGYLIVQVVGTVHAVDSETAMQSLQVFVLEGFCLYVGLSNVVRTPETLRKVMWALLLVGAVLGSLSLHQYMTSAYEQDYLGFAQISEENLQELAMEPFGDHAPPRLVGPIGEQNRYAQMLLMVAPFGLIAARRASRAPYQVIAAGATGLVLIGATLTSSRGGAIAFALLMLAMTGMGYFRIRHLAAVVAVVALLLVAFPRYAERLSSVPDAVSFAAGLGGDAEVDGAVRGRLSSVIGSLRVFAEHPLLGVGPGLYPYYHREQAIEIGLRVENNRQPHSLLPHIAAEGGVVGLTMFLGVVGVTLSQLKRARRALRQVQPGLAHLMTSCTLSIWMYLATGLFLHLSYERYFWMFIALGGAAAAVGLRQAAILSDTRKRPQVVAPDRHHT